MLTESQRDRIHVVLVSPRNPMNIGAVARAMANFGLSRLTVVAPFAPHWREARSAVGAPELLQHAGETDSLATAVADCCYVVGTGTLIHRKPDQPAISLPDLAEHLAPLIAAGDRVAVVFGSEKHGLTRDDLSYCHALVQIPTDPQQPSMNLGQAAAVCFYELSARMPALPGGVDRSPTAMTREPATGRAPSAMLELLAGVIEEAMHAAGYSPRAMQPANRHDLRVLLRKLALSQHDARRILGLFRRILFRLPSAGDRNLRTDADDQETGK